MKLAGKRALITGASQGFGLAVARAFIAEGADVMLCARSGAKLAQSQKELSQVAGGRTMVLAMPADVSDPDDVARLVEASLAELGGLEILVMSAGVYGPKGPVEQVDWSEWSRAVAINLMGTVLTCRAVLPHLKARQSGKIVLLSGGGATKGLPYLSAYAASKAAVVRFCETLAEEVREFGITVNSVAPGALNTRMLDEVLEAGPERVGEKFFRQAVKQKEEGGTPLERGASLCVFLASPESDGITGRLISAVWDPWESLPGRADELRDSDIYTLRRIIPGERGKVWS
ncbi:MAG: SDR family oxidoreductase [Chloroflexi bacterium]|nr:SDR family oxidoreductase [Chloroflexota bacterium]MCL5109041.1 SDR family oxidoreductase [Chloroflexota bacterium]